ncbi:glycosyltransferase family 2 protein [Serratia fonticola]|uniref:glycosyltransferase family 2 protein n=1 Tax=Serratia fonticola TaxID=47917 RepID=UPI0034C6B8A7
MELVSIITPTYNSEKYVEHTYKSILSQTYQNWEWVVTDDCSNDGTYKKLLEIADKDTRVKIFKNNKNSGAAITRNNSIKNAQGRFIAFIDSDDLWLPRKLEKQIAFMNEHRIHFSFTAFKVMSEDGRSSGKLIDINKNGCFSYGDILRKKVTLGCSTVILRRDANMNISMPLIRTGQDYALWLSILKSGYLAHIYPETLTSYRIVANSISRNKYKKALRQWEIYRSIEKLSLIESAYYFVNYAFRAIFR